MKLHFIYSIILAIAFTSFAGAQVRTDSTNSVVEAFPVTEVAPEFIGGNEAMYRFIVMNLKYPATARKEKIQGSVIVSFMVETDGSISEPTILKSVNKACDNEVLRIVKLMPNWKPAMQGGKPVRAKFALPVSFRVSERSRSTY